MAAARKHVADPDRDEPRPAGERGSQAPAAPADAAILALQRSAGNAAVSRLLRAPMPGPTLPTPVAGSPVAAPAPPAKAPFEGDFVPEGPYGQMFVEARKAREDFVKEGKKGPATYDPSTRNKANYYGGFDVEYDPAKSSGELKVTLRGAVDFRNGINLNKGGWAVANEPGAETKAAAAAINKLPKADRAAAVAPWQWSKQGGPEAGDEGTFCSKFKSSVESAWRKKHPFHCTRQWWEDLGAETEFDVQVSEKAKGKTDHMTVAAYKIPVGFDAGAYVKREGTKNDAFSNLMVVTSQDVEQRTDGLLEGQLEFDAGKTALPAKAKKVLQQLAKRMPNAKPGANVGVDDVRVTAFGADEEQRKARFEAIKAVLTGAGMDESRILCVHAGAGDAALVTIGDGVAQTVAAHESGHMFGLDDEYVGKGDYAAGKKTEHTEFAQKEGGFTGIQHAASDAVMSGGAEVMPHHYITFLDALRQVTGMTDWDYGPVQTVTPPSEAGDHPLPAGDGTTVA